MLWGVLGYTRSTEDFVGVSAKCKKLCATAIFLVTYSKKLTENLLSGEEGRELTARNYGPDDDERSPRHALLTASLAARVEPA